MRKAAVVLAFVSLALFDCATLDPLADGACGNGVVDANEDCDGFAPSAIPTAKCGAPSDREKACRLTCGSAADCPDGWGCATTGICREPSGRFAPMSEGVSAGVETLVVGDFDGDRRKDVLGSGPVSLTGTAKVRVHYFGETGQLAQVTTLSAPISSPTVKDFNQDRIDDLAFGLDIGALGVMSGQADRSLVPAVFPSFRVPRVDVKPVLIKSTDRALPSGGGIDFLFAGTLTGNGGATANGLTSTDRGYLHGLPAGVDGIIGEPVWGRFLVDASSTCGEVAIAFKSGANGVVHLYAPCRPGAEPEVSEWAPARAPVVFEPGVPIDGIQVIDEKNDGHSDLLLLSRKAGRPAVFLARGNGGGFDTPLETDLLDLPLASGDLDLDGKVDVVMPGAILLSNRPPAPAGDGGADAGPGDSETPFRGYRAVASERRVRWTAARVGNFNGDAFPDVVAASADQPDLDFFGSLGAGGFVQSSLSTSGPVAHLAAGDFDGDQLIDIGFVQKPPGSGNVFDVAVAYARTNGPPEPPRVVGRTEEALSLQVFGDADIPGIDALALFFRKAPTDGGLPDLSIAVIIGNGDRQPVAPLLLEDNRGPGMEREWVPLEVHAGSVAQAGRVDLIALALGIDPLQTNLSDKPISSAVWVAPGIGGTAFDAPIKVADLNEFVIPGTGAIVFEARTVVGDIDNPKNGTDDVVALQRLPERDALALFIARPDMTGPPPNPIELPNERVRRDAPFVLTDVDADGNLDAVVLLGAGSASKVVVFYNDGAGGFAAPATIAMGEGESPSGFAHLTIAGASTDATRKAKRELAVVTNKRLLLAAPDASDRTKLVTREITTEGPALNAATGIAQGDFDGDGVDDLAIADSGALRILRQLPVRR